MKNFVMSFDGNLDVVNMRTRSVRAVIPIPSQQKQRHELASSELFIHPDNDRKCYHGTFRPKSQLISKEFPLIPIFLQDLTKIFIIVLTSES